jgi:hypothetical protein
MPTDQQIRQTILRKMLYHGFIGGKHTSIENLPKGLPKDVQKRAEEIVDDLRKEGYFILKPKSDALHVSLNPKMLSQVKKEIQQE